MLADEPTGNLDSKTGAEIIAIFQKLHRERHQTVVYVTHDAFTARHTERIIHLADGLVKSEEIVAQPLIAGAMTRENGEEVFKVTAKKEEAAR